MIQYTKEELANEEWRPIKGYEGLYEVSSAGIIITTMSVGMSLNITLVELKKRNNGRD